MHWIFYAIVVNILQLTGTEQAVQHGSFKNDRNFIFANNWSNETHLTWILYPPWKRHNDLFNDKPYNNPVEYFGINKEDHLTNESYIETSKLNVCNEVNFSFYSKMNSSQKNIRLSLFIYKHHVWNKVWEYINQDSQWKFHQIKINLTDKTKKIQFRFIPISNSSDQISIAIAIRNVTIQTNCRDLKSQLKTSLSGRNNSSIHPFLFAIFGSAFFLVFITVMVIFIYGIINKKYNQWLRRRSNRRRGKGWKTRNVIRDESTILGLETAIV